MTRSAETGGLVLGVLSLVLSFVLFWIPYIPLVLGIIGLVLSLQARRVSPGGVATAGFVTSLIGVILSGIYVVISLTCVGIADSIVSGALLRALR